MEEPGPERLVVRPPQGGVTREPEHVDVVPHEHDVPDLHQGGHGLGHLVGGVDAAHGVGDQEGGGADHAHDAHRHGHPPQGVPLVRVQPALPKSWVEYCEQLLEAFWEKCENVPDLNILCGFYDFAVLYIFTFFSKIPRFSSPVHFHIFLKNPGNVLSKILKTKTEGWGREVLKNLHQYDCCSSQFPYD